MKEKETTCIEKSSQSVEKKANMLRIAMIVYRKRKHNVNKKRELYIYICKVSAFTEKDAKDKESTCMDKGGKQYRKIQ